MIDVYEHRRTGGAWFVPVLFWLILRGMAWVTVWSAVWVWEIYTGAAVRAARTTNRALRSRG